MMKALSKALLISLFVIVSGTFVWAGGTQDDRSGAYTGQSSGNQTSSTAPAWVLQPPSASGGNTFFVATGNDPGGNETKAVEAAGIDLIDQINRYMGVTISSESTAEERATDDSYQTSIIGVVTQKATGSVAGLRIADRFISRNNQGVVTVHLLGEYKTVDLEKEKAKRAALIQEKEDAVTVPENQGKRAESGGALYDSIRLYLEAAAAANGSDIRNAEVKFERNIQNSVRVIDRLKIEKVSGPVSGFARQEFTEDFVVSVTDAQSGAAVAGAELTASFREYQDSGRARIRSIQVKTDAGGKASIRLPSPSGVGAEKLTVNLDISAFVRPLESLTGSFKNLSDSVLDTAVGKRVVFDYTVQSMAKQVPTGVLILDLGSGGQAAGGNATAQGIQQRLTSAGFRLGNLSVGANFLLGKSDSEILTLVGDLSAGRVDRVIVGTAQVQEIDDRGSEGVFAKVTGTIMAIDAQTGTILLTVTKLANARGNDQARAITAAFTKLGQDVGDQLTRDLP